jgi:hypothetical protein
MTGHCGSCLSAVLTAEGRARIAACANGVELLCAGDGGATEEESDDDDEPAQVEHDFGVDDDDMCSGKLTLPTSLCFSFVLRSRLVAYW